MAVTSVSEKYGSGKGSAAYPKTNEFTREFHVRVNDVDDGPAVILSDALVPKVGDEYATGNDYDPGSWCKRVDVTRDEANELLFSVVCTYNNEEPEIDRTTPPLWRPAVFDWSNRREEFTFPYDTRGNLYVTPAGVPIENPPPTPIHLLILTISKNVATFNPIAMNAYADSVNLDAFLGFGPGYAKIDDIIPSKLQHETINDVYYQYYTIETVIAFRRIPWHPHRIVAKGRQYKNDDNELVPTDASGVMDGHEEYLDAQGKKTDAANYYLIDRYPFPECSFMGLSQFTGIGGFWF